MKVQSDSRRKVSQIANPKVGDSNPPPATLNCRNAVAFAFTELPVLSEPTSNFPQARLANIRMATTQPAFYDPRATLYGYNYADRCLLLPAQNLVPMKSRRRWARVEWARCIERTTPDWGAMSRRKFCRSPSPETAIVCVALSGHRGLRGNSADLGELAA